jgi:hypothetical protein
MEEHFAKTSFIGEAKGWPIYSQVKASMFYSDEAYSSRSKKTYSEKDRESVKAIQSTTKFYINDEWLMDFIIFWGEERTLEFIKFCDEQFIDDLHNNNIGYVRGIPCLIDYSSFDC